MRDCAIETSNGTANGRNQNIRVSTCLHLTREFIKSLKSLRLASPVSWHTKCLMKDCGLYENANISSLLYISAIAHGNGPLSSPDRYKTSNICKKQAREWDKWRAVPLNNLHTASLRHLSSLHKTKWKFHTRINLMLHMKWFKLLKATLR